VLLSSSRAVFLLQAHEFLIQRLLAFFVLRMRINAGHRADLHALRLVKMANAFGAFVGVDFVNLFAHINRLVRAFGLTHIAVDAFISNPERHG
jgi:hypothetical protein